MAGWTLQAETGRLPRRTRRSFASLRLGRFWGLTVLVAAWWLSIAAVVAQTLPAPAASAPWNDFLVAPGRVVRINQPGMTSWPIPVDRSAFDALRRAYRESDEDTIERASEATEWTWTRHGQAVQVIRVDGEAIEIVTLEGETSGRRGWLLTRHLHHDNGEEWIYLVP